MGGPRFDAGALRESDLLNLGSVDDAPVAGAQIDEVEAVFPAL